MPTKHWNYGLTIESVDTPSGLQRGRCVMEWTVAVLACVLVRR